MSVELNEREWLAGRFEEQRPYLQAVAYRMLGSLAEAEDAVQDSWIRVSRAGADGVENWRGWLTTVVARVCLNMLQSRRSRREEPLDEPDGSGIVELSDLSETGNPEQEMVLASSVGLAMLVMLDALAPAERVVFVLHDVFAVPFDEIAPVVGRSPAATRQLASRARRRLRGATAKDSLPDTDLRRHRQVIDAFLAAARGGDFTALLNVLDPEVVLRADETAVGFGFPGHLRGAAAVAQRAVAAGARAAEPGIVDGAVGLVIAPHGSVLGVMRFAFARGRIVEIEAIASPERLQQLSIAIGGEDPPDRMS